MNEDMGPDGRGWKSEVVEYDLGWACPGQSVVFNTTRSVYVSVMDEKNYTMFKCDAEGYTAYRGQIQSSPFRFRIPSEGHWHAVLDPRTYSGIAEFSVRLMDDTVLDR